MARQVRSHLMFRTGWGIEFCFEMGIVGVLDTAVINVYVVTKTNQGHSPY